MELVPREFSPQFCLNISRSEKEGRVEMRDRKRKKRKRRGNSWRWGEKETGRRQMKVCNHCVLRILFTVTGSCLTYEIESGHQ